MEKNKKIAAISFKGPSWMILETDDGQRQMKENVFDKDLIAKVKGLGPGTHHFRYEQKMRKDGKGLAWDIVDVQPIVQPPMVEPARPMGQAQTRPNGQDLDKNVAFQNMSYIAQVAIKAAAETITKMAERGSESNELLTVAGQLAELYMTKGREHLAGGSPDSEKELELEAVLNENNIEAPKEVPF